MNLDRATAVITGGSGYLGQGIVRALEAKGARVANLDRVLPPDLGAIRTILCNVSDPQDIRAALRALEDEWQSPPSILVNSAGRIHNAPLLNILDPLEPMQALAAWESAIKDNLTTTFVATAAIAERMMKTRTRGVIVSLSSVCAKGNAGQGAYSASKAGVEAAMVAWAKELGPVGIRFVTISPGFIDTPSTADSLSDGQIVDWKRRIVLRRLGTVEEVSDSVIFAITNNYLTGTVLHLDGGLAL